MIGIFPNCLRFRPPHLVEEAPDRRGEPLGEAAPGRRATVKRRVRVGGRLQHQWRFPVSGNAASRVVVKTKLKAQIPTKERTTAWLTARPTPSAPPVTVMPL